MLIVDKGSMFCKISGEECFFFDIDVKGGERRVESECMWVLVLPSMPKGEIVGKCLTGSICLSLMESTAMKMARVQEECNRHAP